MKSGRYIYSISILLVCLLPLFFVGCGHNKEISNIKDTLKRASDQTLELRLRVDRGTGIQNLSDELEDIENLINDALDELYYIYPDYY